jgi:hypothetical protein
MKSQIEKSNQLLVDFKNIENLYSKGFELIKDFENGSIVPSKNLNVVVRELDHYNNIGTRFLSVLIDCKNNDFLSNPEIKANIEGCLISIMNVKHKYRNLNFLIRQDLLKTMINIGHEIQSCLDSVEQEQLEEVA